MPECDHLLRSTPRRPGELHEPIRLTTAVARSMSEQAADFGLAPDVAAALLLEAQLLLEDLHSLGADTPSPPPVRCVTRRLSAAEADYLRSLTLCRPAAASAGAPQRVALPVRLIPHAGSDRLRRAAHVDLSRIVQWEVAALLAAMTMREWGLRCAALGGAPA